MSDTGLVTLTTPTRDRDVLHQLLAVSILSQSHRNFEWLICDDSDRPSPFFSSCADSRVKYLHMPGRQMTVGEKRNHLASLARGAIIFQIDDDDFYAPDYVESIASFMRNGNVDFFSLNGWFVYDFRTSLLGYRYSNVKTGLFYLLGPDAATLVNITDPRHPPFARSHLGYGFCYAYRKTVTDGTRWNHLNLTEDTDFASRIPAHLVRKHMTDATGICLHNLHGTNTAVHAVNYLLPSFMTGRFFPGFNLAAYRECLGQRGT